MQLVMHFAAVPPCHPNLPTRSPVTMSKPRIELKVPSSNASAPLEESLALPDADGRPEDDVFVDRWAQHGEDRSRQTRCYSIRITLPGRTA